MNTRRPPQRPQSKLAGYLILGLGLLACLAVGILAVKKMGILSRYSVPPEQREPLTPDMMATESSESSSAADSGIEGKDLKQGRPKDLIGLWRSDFEEGAMVLQMEGGVYQMRVSLDYAALPDQFSSGTYELEQGSVLTFMPRLDWDEPEEPGTSFVRVATSPFSMRVSRFNDSLVWQMVVEEDPRRHPVLRYGLKGIVVWDPMP